LIINKRLENFGEVYMCLGFPGVIEWMDDFSAKVDIAGTKREVSLMMMPDEVVVGDWVMVHAGFAIAKMDPEEAKKTLDAIREAVDMMDENSMESW
jgi:hydrogenase expression/formation protein HypC